MIASRSIEAKIAEAVSALKIDDAEVISVWEFVAAGNVKAWSSAATVQISVRASLPVPKAFLSPAWTMQCAIDLKAPRENDPTGGAFVAAEEIIESWLVGINGGAVDLSSISPDDGSFVVDGVKLGGGEPMIDTTSGDLSISNSFSVFGHFSAA